MNYIGMPKAKLKAKLRQTTFNQKTAIIIFLDNEPTDNNQTLLKLIEKYPHLILNIDDINQPYQELPNLIAPTTNTAQQIINFINQHTHDNFIISCTAGVSRTGAVIHYLDTLTNYNRNWQQHKDQESTYYQCRKYLPNQKLDHELQNIIKKHRQYSHNRV